MTGKEETKKSKAEVLKEGFAMLDAEYGDKLTEQTRIYKKELFKKIIGNYPKEKIMKMCIELIKTRKYSNFPKVAEMIELIEGNKEEEAELAWLILREKMNKFGYYKSVSFPENPVIGAVVEAMGGWMKMFDMKVDEEKWVRKDFVKMHQIFKKEGKIYSGKLIGMFELENNKKGYTDEIMLAKYKMHLDGTKIKRKLLTDKNEIGKNK